MTTTSVNAVDYFVTLGVQDQLVVDYSTDELACTGGGGSCGRQLWDNAITDMSIVDSGWLSSLAKNCYSMFEFVLSR
jgi:hypothetical protein